MRNGQAGTAECRIQAGSEKCLRDAYGGMVLYGSNMYDPTATYTSLTLNQPADMVFFTPEGCGFGKGPPVGPPVAVQPQSRKAKPAAAAQPTAIGGTADTHGSSLTVAYSGDLLNQGRGAAADEGGAGGGDDMIEVPGMGMMNRSAIPVFGS